MRNATHPENDDRKGSVDDVISGANVGMEQSGARPAVEDAVKKQSAHERAVFVERVENNNRDAFVVVPTLVEHSSKSRAPVVPTMEQKESRQKAKLCNGVIGCSNRL